MADYLEARFTYDPGRVKVWRAIVNDLEKRFIAPGGAVLELGCGYGDFINQVRASRKVAVDLLPQVAPHLAPEVEFHPGQAGELGFLEDQSLDVVFASNLLEHLERPAVIQVLGEAGRVLKRGGRLILIQPNYRLCFREYFDDYTHVSVFSDESLCGLLLSQGWDIECRRARYLPLTIKSRLPKSYWLTRLYLGLKVPLLARQMLIVAHRS
ncbi:MAG: class I SAM-dependent methyltransferase [Desulfarculus sp.]|nr:class I SAM-dependent methyltransferase [Desulfarculus sp.]